MEQQQEANGKDHETNDNANHPLMTNIAPNDFIQEDNTLLANNNNNQNNISIDSLSFEYINDEMDPELAHSGPGNINNDSNQQIMNQDQNQFNQPIPIPHSKANYRRKESRTGMQYQAVINEQPPKATEEVYQKAIQFHQQKYQIKRLLKYDSHRLPDAIVEEYLTFARQLGKDSKSDNDGLLFGSAVSYEQIDEQALNFLQNVDYSVIRAKFGLLFPSLIYFNKFSKAPPHQLLHLTEADMELKIQAYITQLQETKLSQHEKWKQELQELFQQRVHINRITQFLEQGRQMRYEVPEYVREIFEKATKFSKDLRKASNDKVPLPTLFYLAQIAETEHKIITPDMISFQEGLERSKAWTSKLEELKTRYCVAVPIVQPVMQEPAKEAEQQYQINNTEPTQTSSLREEIMDSQQSQSSQQQQQPPQPQQVQYLPDQVPFRELQLLVQEYKGLPVYNKEFESVYRNMYDKAGHLLEKIPNFTRISKTRQTKDEKLSICQGEIFAKEIIASHVKCDEFDSYLVAFERSKDCFQRMQELYQEFSIIGNANMEQSSQILLNLLAESNEQQFTDEVQDRLQNLKDQFTLLEKIQHAAQQKSKAKLDEVIRLVEEARKRKLCTQEMEAEEFKARQAIQWYSDFQLLYNEREDFILTKMYDEINLDPPLMQEKILNDLKRHISQFSSISVETIKQLDQRLEDIENWKKQCQEMREASIKYLLPQWHQNNINVPTLIITPAPLSTPQLQFGVSTDQPSSSGEVGVQSMSNYNNYTSNISLSFDEMVKLLNTGIKLNVDFNELRKGFQFLRGGIAWILDANQTIKEFDPKHKTQIFSDEIFHSLKIIKQKKEDNIPLSIASTQISQMQLNYMQQQQQLKYRSYGFIKELLDRQNLPLLCYKSEEYNKLKILFDLAEEWNQQVNKIIQTINGNSRASNTSTTTINTSSINASNANASSANASSTNASSTNASSNINNNLEILLNSTNAMDKTEITKLLKHCQELIQRANNHPIDPRLGDEMHRIQCMLQWACQASDFLQKSRQKNEATLFFEQNGIEELEISMQNTIQLSQDYLNKHNEVGNSGNNGSLTVIQTALTAVQQVKQLRLEFWQQNDARIKKMLEFVNKSMNQIIKGEQIKLGQLQKLKEEGDHLYIKSPYSELKICINQAIEEVQAWIKTSQQARTFERKQRRRINSTNLGINQIISNSTVAGGSGSGGSSGGGGLYRKKPKNKVEGVGLLQQLQEVQKTINQVNRDPQATNQEDNSFNPIKEEAVMEKVEVTKLDNEEEYEEGDQLNRENQEFIKQSPPSQQKQQAIKMEVEGEGEGDGEVEALAMGEGVVAGVGYEVGKAAEIEQKDSLVNSMASKNVSGEIKQTKFEEKVNDEEAEDQDQSAANKQMARADHQQMPLAAMELEENKDEKIEDASSIIPQNSDIIKTNSEIQALVQQLPPQQQQQQQQLDEEQQIEERNLLRKIGAAKSDLQYYYKLPILLVKFYHGIRKNMQIEELVHLQTALQVIQSVVSMAQEKLSHKLTMEDLHTYLTTAVSHNIFFVEFNILRKLEKWATTWQSLAREIIDSQPKLRLRTKQSVVSVLPKDFMMTKYAFTFDEKTFTLSFCPAANNIVNQNLSNPILFSQTTQPANSSITNAQIAENSNSEQLLLLLKQKNNSQTQQTLTKQGLLEQATAQLLQTASQQSNLIASQEDQKHLQNQQKQQSSSQQQSQEKMEVEISQQKQQMKQSPQSLPASSCDSKQISQNQKKNNTPSRKPEELQIDKADSEVQSPAIKSSISNKRGTSGFKSTSQSKMQSSFSQQKDLNQQQQAPQASYVSKRIKFANKYYQNPSIALYGGNEDFKKLAQMGGNAIGNSGGGIQGNTNPRFNSLQIQPFHLQQLNFQTTNNNNQSQFVGSSQRSPNKRRIKPTALLQQNANFEPIPQKRVKRPKMVIQQSEDPANVTMISEIAAQGTAQSIGSSIVKSHARSQTASVAKSEQNKSQQDSSMKKTSPFSLINRRGSSACQSSRNISGESRNHKNRSKGQSTFILKSGERRCGVGFSREGTYVSIQQQQQVPIQAQQTSTQGYQQNNQVSINKQQYIQENPHEKFCICRMGCEPGVTMVGCDSCDEWFHIECIGIKASHVRQINKYICIGCQKRYCLNNNEATSTNTTIGSNNIDFRWSICERISLEQFMKFVQEGQQIPVQMDEQVEIIDLQEQINNWQEVARQILNKGSQIESLYTLNQCIQKLKGSSTSASAQSQSASNKDRNIEEFYKSQEQRDREIFKHFLESFRFPVQFLYADEILLLMQRRDLAQQLLKYLHEPSSSLQKIEGFLKGDLAKYDLPRILDKQEKEPELHCLLTQARRLTDRTTQFQQQLDKSQTNVNNVKDLLQQAEREDLLIDQYVYKQMIKEFENWEQQAAQVFVNSNKTQDYLQELCDQHQRLKICQSQYYPKVLSLLEKAKLWDNQAQKILSGSGSLTNSSGQGGISDINSTNTVQQLLAEAKSINCELKFKNVLEQFLVAQSQPNFQLNFYKQFLAQSHNSQFNQFNVGDLFNNNKKDNQKVGEVNKIQFKGNQKKQILEQKQWNQLLQQQKLIEQSSKQQSNLEIGQDDEEDDDEEGEKPDMQKEQGGQVEEEEEEDEDEEEDDEEEEEDDESSN